MPRCSRCGEEKSVEEFYQDASRPSGYSSFCKPCKRIYHHNHHLTYKERRRELRKRMFQAPEQKVRKMAATIVKERLDDQDRARKKFLSWKYKLTEEEFEERLNSQNRKCAICEADLRTLSSKRVHIDHSHETGEYRGILCGHCNAVLGMARDNPEILRRAATYLESK